MKPHPRIRKTIKWTGAAVTVLLVVVWIGSRWVWFGWDGTGHMYAIGCGTFFTVSRDSVQRGSGAFCIWAAPSKRFDWWHSSIHSKSVSQVAWPLWPVVIPPLVLACATWSLDTLARRRERAHLCAKCGYDRTGILQDAK